jgi:SPOR domain
MRNLVMGALAVFALAEPVDRASAEMSWGVQIAGSYSEPGARTAYETLQRTYPEILTGQAPTVLRGVMIGGGTGNFYSVVIPAASRFEADAFCARLETAGGACVVGRTKLPAQ